MKFKISLRVDDPTLFLADIASLSNSKTIFNKFGECSGIKLNLHKTEIIPIGKTQNKQIKLPNHLNSINI